MAMSGSLAALDEAAGVEPPQADSASTAALVTAKAPRTLFRCINVSLSMATGQSAAIGDAPGCRAGLCRGAIGGWMSSHVLLSFAVWRGRGACARSDPPNRTHSAAGAVMP